MAEVECSSSDDDANRIRIQMLTLNCWALPNTPILGSRDRAFRIREIGQFLASHHELDIVSLQEIWRIEDYELIEKMCSKNLPFAHRFASGVIGSGVAIFSKFKIDDLMSHRFSVNGYAHHVHRGDWYGGKVVGLARLYIPSLNTHLNIFSTHVHAEYDRIKDIYLAHRVVQSLEIAQLVRLTSGQNLAFLMGDLNLEPDDLGYRIIRHVAGMKDCWIERKADSGGSKKALKIRSGKNATLSEDRCSSALISNDDDANGFTCDRSDCCYGMKLICRRPKRIDYILYRDGMNSEFRVTVNNCRIDMNKVSHNNMQDINYSDHAAVRTDITIDRIKRPVFDSQMSLMVTDDGRQCLTEALKVLEEGACSSRYNRLFFAAGAGALFAVFLLLFYIGARWPETVHFGGIIVATFLLALICGFHVWHGAVVLVNEENALSEARRMVEVMLR